MKILVSGGTGYIGSHTAVELLEKGFEVVAIDNFSNSSPEVLNRIKTITGKEVTFTRAIFATAICWKRFFPNRVSTA